MGKRVIALILALNLLCGCGASIPLLLEDRARKPERNELANAVMKTLEPGMIEFHETRDEGDYTVYFFVYRSFRVTNVRQNDFLKGEYYHGAHQAKKLAILLPGMGESESTAIASEVLARHGYDVVRFFSGIEIFDKETLKQCEHCTEEQFIHYARRGAEAIQTRYFDLFALTRYFKKTYGYSRVGIAGVSLGGVTAAYLSGRYPDEYQSLVGIVLGGDLAHILMVSREPNIEKARDEIFRRFDITPEKMVRILDRELKNIDPLSVAENIRPESTLFVTNYFDGVIPRFFTRELWQAAPRPEWWYLHIPPLWYIWPGKDLIHRVDAHYTSFLSLIMPTPLVRFIIPIGFKSADIVILDHFEKTL